MAQVLGNQQQQPKIDLSQAKDMNCIKVYKKIYQKINNYQMLSYLLDH